MVVVSGEAQWSALKEPPFLGWELGAPQRVKEGHTDGDPGFRGTEGNTPPHPFPHPVTGLLGGWGEKAESQGQPRGRFGDTLSRVGSRQLQPLPRHRGHPESSGDASPLTGAKRNSS